MLIVTHTWNGAVYDTVPVGVWYDGSNWTIFNEDSSPMDTGETFNVLVASAPTNTGIANLMPDQMGFKVYPNPASEQVTINYTLNGNSDVSIKLYAADGREIKTVYQGNEGKGYYTLQHNTTELQPGSYYMVLSTEESRATYPVVIIR